MNQYNNINRKFHQPKNLKMKFVPWDISIPEHLDNQIGGAMTDMKIPDNRLQFTNIAFSLLIWAVQQKKKGFTIAAIREEPDGSMYSREIIDMEGLDDVDPVSR